MPVAAISGTIPRMTRLAIAGALGRMGRCVLECAVRTPGIDVVCGLVAPDSDDTAPSTQIDGRDISLARQLEASIDVLIDVSMPRGTVAWASVCEHRDIPMVTGVTGLDESQQRRLREASHQIPIVQSANFSVGLHAVLGILGPIVQPLGETYDVEIVEVHHREKVDAPSGTALAIAHAIQKSSGQNRTELIFGRQGRVGPRPARQIAIHAVRMGDVVGRHEIHLAGTGETVTITHEAQSREAFAAGAIRAAAWIVGKGAGFYTMADVLRETGAEPGRKEIDPGF
jgi:4-hydroxy-tetrahydrodipicolinate reductase